MAKLSYEELDAMSLELNDWQTTFLEEGMTQRGALLSAHDKIEEKYGQEKYEEFEAWLEKGSAGPYG
jgi:predicted phage gp36 major capsid-like protein